MDEGDRSIFDFTMPPRRNVIMLGGDAGRWPKAVKLDLDGDGGRFEELALLHAASGGDATLVVTLDYGDGHSETKRLQVLDWNTDAIRFYERFGASFSDEWLNGSLERDALLNLAAR